MFSYTAYSRIFSYMASPREAFLQGYEREKMGGMCAPWTHMDRNTGFFLIFTYCTFFFFGLFFIILNCAWDNSWFLKVQRLNLLINFSDYQGINATHTAKTIMTSLPIWWWCMKKASPGTQNQQARLWHGPSKVWWVTEAETGPVLLRKESRKSPFLCLLYHGSFLWKIILALTKKSQTWNKLDFYFIPL